MDKRKSNYWILLIGMVLLVVPLLAKEIPLTIEGEGVIVNYQFEVINVGCKDKEVQPVEIIEKEAGILKQGTLIEMRLESGQDIKEVKVPDIEVIGDLVLSKPKVIVASVEGQKSILIGVERSSTIKSKIILKNGSISVKRETQSGESYPLSIKIGFKNEWQTIKIPKLLETKYPNVYEEVATRWTIDDNNVTSNKDISLPKLKAPPYIVQNSMMIPLRYYMEEVCEDAQVMGYENNIITYQIKDKVMQLKVGSNQVTLGQKSIYLKDEIQLKNGYAYMSIENINLICNNTLPEQQVKIRWIIPNKIVEIINFNYYIE